MTRLGQTDTADQVPQFVEKFAPAWSDLLREQLRRVGALRGLAERWPGERGARPRATPERGSDRADRVRVTTSHRLRRGGCDLPHGQTSKAAKGARRRLNSGQGGGASDLTRRATLRSGLQIFLSRRCITGWITTAGPCMLRRVRSLVS